MANLNHSDFKNFAGSKEFKAILKSKLDVKFNRIAFIFFMAILFNIAEWIS